MRRVTMCAAVLAMLAGRVTAGEPEAIAAQNNANLIWFGLPIGTGTDGKRAAAEADRYDALADHLTAILALQLYEMEHGVGAGLGPAANVLMAAGDEDYDLGNDQLDAGFVARDVGTQAFLEGDDALTAGDFVTAEAKYNAAAQSWADAGGLFDLAAVSFRAASVHYKGATDLLD